MKIEGFGEAVRFDELDFGDVFWMSGVADNQPMIKVMFNGERFGVRLDYGAGVEIGDAEIVYGLNAKVVPE